MDSKSTIRHLWYTRRGSVVRGPFPPGLIARYLLIGRISLEDEVSSDQIRWVPVQEVDELVPDELKGNPNDPEVQERLRIARRREDERAAGDRRNREGSAQDERRRRDDRRQPEPEDLLQHRNLRTSLAKERRSNEDKQRLWAVFGLAILIIGAIVAAFVFMPEAPPLKLQCDVPPAPQVNWSNCRFEGAVLNNANLAGGQLGNANFTGAQFRSANLSGSNLAYANLSRSDLRNADFRRAKAVGTTLRNANLQKVNAQEADFGYSILQGADLSGADFKNADLTKADLSDAKIDGAIFEGAHLGGAIWTDKRICAPESVGVCNP